LMRRKKNAVQCSPSFPSVSFAFFLDLRCPLLASTRLHDERHKRTVTRDPKRNQRFKFLLSRLCSNAPFSVREENRRCRSISMVIDGCILSVLIKIQITNTDEKPGQTKLRYIFRRRLYRKV
jgi:hypothetical protein